MREKNVLILTHLQGCRYLRLPRLAGGTHDRKSDKSEDLFVTSPLRFGTEALGGLSFRTETTHGSNRHWGQIYAK